MKHCCLLLMLVVGVVALACKRIKVEPKNPSGRQAAAEIPAAKDKPPAAKNDEPLLLLDNGPDDKPTTGPVADNSRCHVCHLNFAQEPLAVWHARANVSCEKCHGPSDAHIADESWASGGNGTAPDIMYLPEQINPSCMECHPKEKLTAGARCLFASAPADKKHCTDCHGNHRMAARRCKWK
ncbi:MAG: hypothetical protein N3D11_13445 [Candidatus Sumerlaeia bacterium]|nr:hypothetical protein [Candidatus Sumerlaeia bacterium]